jgi:hypothetical protein
MDKKFCVETPDARRSPGGHRRSEVPSVTRERSSVGPQSSVYTAVLGRPRPTGPSRVTTNAAPRRCTRPFEYSEHLKTIQLHGILKSSTCK